MTQHRILQLQRRNRAAPANRPQESPNSHVLQEEEHRQIVRTISLAANQDFRALQATLGAVGDHTWTHPFLRQLPPAAVEREIASTQRALERLTGTPILLFRPRFARFVPAARSERAAIVHTLARSLHPGSILLLHENLGQTQLALPTILRRLRAAGLTTQTQRDRRADRGEPNIDVFRAIPL